MQVKRLIQRIHWRRTYLFVELDAMDTQQGPKELALVDEKTRRRVPFRTEPGQGDTLTAVLNLTIAGGRELLPAGRWAIVDAATGEPESVSDEVLFSLEDAARVFRYSKNRFAYTVTFSMAGVDDDAHLVMVVTYMRLNKHPEVQEGRLLPIKRALNAYYQVVSHVVPKRGNKVLFLSENMDHIRDNMLAIDTRLRERGLDQRFKLSYDFHNIFGRRQDPVRWLKTITKVACQDFVFVDDYVPMFGFLKLHPKTKLIQVWHAGFGFKLVGYGRFGIDGSPHPFVSCHRKYDWALVGNEHLREVYSEVFGIEEEALLATGMPRLDHFLDPGHIEACWNAFFDAHPDMAGRRIVLFAPTYRGLKQQDAHYDYDQLDLGRLHDWCVRTNSAVIFKQHHFISEPWPIPDEYRDRMIELSGESLNDLMYVADVLVTDYSSCFYDYLLLGRPVLFFTYDRARYCATRGVHRPVDEVAPGRVCDSFDELMDAFETGDFGDVDAADMLRDKAADRDGLASDKVIDFILLGNEVPGICKR